MTMVDEGAVELSEKLSPPLHRHDFDRWAARISCWLGGVILLFAFGSIQMFFVMLVLVGLGFVLGHMFADGPGYKYPSIWFEEYLHVKRSNALINEDGEVDESRRRSKKDAIDIHIIGLPRDLDPRSTDTIGTYYNPDQRAYTVVVEGQGWAGEASVGGEKLTQDLQIASLVLNAANVIGPGANVTMVNMKRPYNIQRIKDVEAFLPPQVKAALPAIAAGKMPTNRYERMAYDHLEKLQLIESGEVGQDMYAWTALTARQPANWPRDITDGKLSRDELVSSPIVRAAKRLEANLQSGGIRTAEATDLEAMSTLTHLACKLDPQDWFNPPPKEDRGPGMYLEEDFGEDYPWPRKEILTGRDIFGLPYIDFDGSKHRIWRAAGIDNRVVTTDEYRALYETRDIFQSGRTGLIVATSGELFVSRRASRRMTPVITLTKALYDILQQRGNGGHLSEQEIRDSEQHQSLQYLLDTGGKMGFFYNSFVITSGLDLKALNEADRALDQHARDSGLILAPTRRRSRLARLFCHAGLGVPTV